MRDLYVDRVVGDPAERTVRDVLTTMAAAEWLDTHTAPEDGQRLYSAGEKLDAVAEQLVEPA